MHSDLGWLSKAMLHGSGWGLMLRIEAHFDESGTDQNEITVAGYLFEAEKIDRFCDEWITLLRRNDIPYLHMADFAPGNAPFHKIENRTRLQMQFMRLIKSHSINGIVCNIQNDKSNNGLSYLTGAKGAVRAVLDWADKTAYDGKIAYFFEAGATGQGLVEGEFQRIAKDPAISASHRYAGHGFLPKEGNPGVQAADFLAWQYHNFTKKRAKADLARLDMRALMRHPHLINDKCGEPPRRSRAQSCGESRGRLEYVHYLPAITPEEAKGLSVLVAGADGFGIMVQGDAAPTGVLACPNCWRSLIESHHNRVINMAFKCWCGTYSFKPAILPPHVVPLPLIPQF